MIETRPAALRAEPKGAAGEYRPQIDGLRALAMIGVLYVHFVDTTPVTEHVRVTLFFVVSGFLITHILLTAKERGKTLIVGNFYVRRALRLFPALIVTFLLSYALDADGFRASAAWHILPTSNIYFALTEKVSPWPVGHLWSLNVLEQFYLLWPLVILGLSLRNVWVVTIGLFAAISFLRVNGEYFGSNGWWRFLVLSGDPILVGVIAYLVQRQAEARAVLLAPWARMVAIFVLFAPFYLWEGFGESQTYRFAAQPALAVIVVGAYAGYRGPLGAILGSALSRFVSKISYGVYVYHLPLWYVISIIYPPLFAKGWSTFAVMSAMTVLAATLSWYLLEEPVSRLKSRFPTALQRAKQEDRRPKPAGEQTQLEVP